MATKRQNVNEENYRILEDIYVFEVSYTIKNSLQ